MCAAETLETSFWAALQGTWLDEDGAAMEIRGKQLLCPDAKVLPLARIGQDRVVLRIGRKSFQGGLSSTQQSIAWDDGQNWLRAEVPGPADRVTLLVQHAVDAEQQQVRLVLPRRAQIKHVRAALTRALQHEDFALLTTTTAGWHRIVKNLEPVADLSAISIVRADLQTCPAEIVVSDSEVSVAGGEDQKQDQDLSAATATADSPASASAGVRGVEKNQSAGSQEKAAAGQNVDVDADVAVAVAVDVGLGVRLGVDLDVDVDVVRTAGEPFERVYAIKLQRELLARFSEPSFQQRLRALDSMRAAGGGEGGLESFARQRQELLLSVQRQVLPRYGFEGSQLGVQRMMSEWGPFLLDPEFRALTMELNELLGIDMPPETWERSVANFRRLVATTQPQAMSASGSAPPSVPGVPGVVSRCMAIAGGHVMGRAAPRCPVVTAGIADVFSQAASNAAAATATAAIAAQPRPKPWRSARPPAFKLWIAGSWDGYDPDEMSWQSQTGGFAYKAMVGRDCLETFQLLVDGDWQRSLYPSVEDASAFEAHTVLGPDDRGHGLNWCIGKLERTRPGALFVISAQLDVEGNVMSVAWQETS